MHEALVDLISGFKAETTLKGWRRSNKLINFNHIIRWSSLSVYVLLWWSCWPSTASINRFNVNEVSADVIYFSMKDAIHSDSFPVNLIHSSSCVRVNEVKFITPPCHKPQHRDFILQLFNAPPRGDKKVSHSYFTETETREWETNRNRESFSWSANLISFEAIFLLSAIAKCNCASRVNLSTSHYSIGNCNREVNCAKSEM